MTIASTTSKVSYNGSGSVGPFPITFKFTKNADITATKRSSAGVETVLALTTDYTLTGAGDAAGGALTLTVALAVGESLVIARAPGIVQEVDYVENSAFPAETHEGALDLLTMICQSLQEQIDRAVKVEISSTTNPDDLLAELAVDVASAAASAATATTQAGLANTARTGAEDARDLAQEWSENPEGTAITGHPGEYSAYHWSKKAEGVVNIGWSRRNRICNGDFRVDNINAGAAVTPAATSYVADNSVLGMTQASKITAQRVSASLVSFPYSERFTVASVATVGAADGFTLQKRIEGFDFADMRWGTAAAEDVTVSFTIKVSVAGVYAFAVENIANTRSYLFTKTLLADTETYVVETIPGCTDGVWPIDNTAAVRVVFGLGVGSNYSSSTEDSWLSGNYQRVTGTVQLVEHAGATYEISGVQIEKGSFATPFEVLPYQQAEAWCQRYHPTFATDGEARLGWNGLASSTTVVLAGIQFPVAARITPTGLVISDSTKISVSDGVTIIACTVVTFAAGSQRGAQVNCTVASGLTQYRPHRIYANGAVTIRFTGAEL